MTLHSDDKRLTTSYILWAAGFLGVYGLHRLYNGKIVSGLIWFCTFGLLFVGQFIDVFLVPRMVEAHQRKLKAAYGTDTDSSDRVTVDVTPQEPSRNDKMVMLLKAANKHNGKLSVTQGVMETGMDFEEVEELLMDMLRAGYVGVDNHPSTGVVIYRFDELNV